MDFGTSEFAARSLTLSDDAVRQELKKLNLNANIYQLEKRRCCKRFNLEAESLPAVLFYRIMKRDWDRTAAQFEKARGRMRVRKRPARLFGREADEAPTVGLGARAAARAVCTLYISGDVS